MIPIQLHMLFPNTIKVRTDQEMEIMGGGLEVDEFILMIELIQPKAG
jgi:hypothetical protein